MNTPRKERTGAVARGATKGNGVSNGSKNIRTSAATETAKTLRVGELIAAGVAVLASFLWSYWPACVRMVNAWESQPDYSHGYLVPPLAIFFLWTRRKDFPGLAGRLAWPGALLILVSIGVRALGARLFVDAIDAWSLIIWAAGVVWFIGGWRVLVWASPAIAFLFFMIPLPFRAEQMLSSPLQSIATTLSTWSLQLLGQPAIAEQHVIYLGDQKLEVEQACSGLRIFVGIFAMAFAYVILVRRTWWERGLLLASALPVALVANATRIVVTGLLFQWASDEAAHRFTHDVSGYLMIPFAAGLFALVLWYICSMTREMESVTAGDLL